MPADYLPVPHLEQTSDGDCLPICAAMILAYLQTPTEPDRLARLFDTQPYGSIASRILRLTEWGYLVAYQSGSLAILKNLLATGVPAIVFVWTGNLPYWSIDTPHAVVVVGIQAENILVNDPAFSRASQSVAIGDFLLAWAEFDYRYATIVRQAL